MPLENLLLDRDGPVAVITVNRPKALNALNAITIAELGEVVGQLALDAGVRVLVFTGASDRAFASEAARFGRAVAGEDAKEGLAAFLTKRPVHWKGR